jgi:pentatricopeptide repeat protein
MLIPCECFLHAPAPPLSNSTASVCREKTVTFQINAASAPARTAEVHPKLAVPCMVDGLTPKRKEKSNWLHYGGSLPAVLEALECVQDVGEALWPWKDRLSNRERTIILKEQKDWRRAVEIFDWFRREKGHEVNVIHYNVVLYTVGWARRWDLVLLLWHEMHSYGVAPDNSTYGTLIDVCCKGGREKAAFIWLGDMCKRGLIPDEVTMSTVLQAHKKAGEFERAERFFKRWSLDHSMMKEGQPRYSLNTYNTLIDTYGKSGQLEKVSGTFDQMLREGVAPNVVTFNTMIHVSGKHHRMEQVASLVSMMEEFQCFPDTRTYNILISLYRENNDVNAAENCFRKMKAENLAPDVVSYRTLLYGYSIRGMVTKAEALLKEMDERGFSIDEYTQTALTRMYVNAGLLEKAWCWFDKFHYRMNSECFSANIDAFGEERYVVLAEKAFICCLKRKMLSVSVCNVMIKAYGLVEKLDEACEIADGMEMHGILPDYLTYSSVIQLLSTAKLPKKAVYYLRKMQTAKLLSDCIPYPVVISSFAKNGDISMVECLFNEMITSGIRADAFVYSIIIDAYAEVGNVRKAAAYFGLMKKYGLSENHIVCNSLIKLYTKAGYLAEARETYKLLRSLNGGASLYASNCMIDLYSDYCMVKEAREVFENLKVEGSANEFSHAMMVCLYKKVGRFDEAHRICKEMQCSGLLTQALSYNSVIQMYVSGGRMDEAFKIFKKMLVSKIPTNDATFKALKVILVKGGTTKTQLKKLELLRTNNTHDCLYQWYLALSSSVSSSQHSVIDQSACRIHPFDIGNGNSRKKYKKASNKKDDFKRLNS